MATAQFVKLPAFPVMPEQSLSDGQEMLELSLNVANLEDFFIGSPVNSEALERGVDELEAEQPQADANPLDPLQSVEYPVSTLWVFDQSKRLEEQQSYYLDHPKMGMLVTIKPHEVEITNPLEEADLETDLEAGPEPE